MDSFCVWLLSFSKLVLRLIHVFEWIRFFLLWSTVSWLGYMKIYLSIFLLMDISLAFQRYADVNKFATDTSTQVPFFTYVFMFCEYLEVGLLDRRVSACLPLWEITRLISDVHLYVYTSTDIWWEFQLLRSLNNMRCCNLFGFVFFSRRSVLIFPFTALLPK